MNVRGGAIEILRMRLITRQQLLRKFAHVFLKCGRIDCGGLAGLRPGEEWLSNPKPHHASEYQDGHTQDQTDPDETQPSLTLPTPQCLDRGAHAVGVRSPTVRGGSQD